MISIVYTDDSPKSASAKDREASKRPSFGDVSDEDSDILYLGVNPPLSPGAGHTAIEVHSSSPLGSSDKENHPPTALAVPAVDHGGSEDQGVDEQPARKAQQDAGQGQGQAAPSSIATPTRLGTPWRPVDVSETPDEPWYWNLGSDNAHNEVVTAAGAGEYLNGSRIRRR